MGSDTSELQRLIADVKAIPYECETQGYNIIDDSSFRIKSDWQARWTGYRHIPHLPRAIRYDITVANHVVTSEIGPQPGRYQARLGSFIEYGTRTSGPIPGALPAFAAEEERFVHNITNIEIPGFDVRRDRKTEARPTIKQARGY